MLVDIVLEEYCVLVLYVIVVYVFLWWFEWEWLLLWVCDVFWMWYFVEVGFVVFLFCDVLFEFVLDDDFVLLLVEVVVLCVYFLDLW